MPSFNFVLPHWVYWGTLLVFPLVAMYMVARQRRLGAPREPILFNAYLFWVTSGFMGLHRMYLKSWWGFLYVPFFVARPVLQRPGSRQPRGRLAYHRRVRAGAARGQVGASRSTRRRRLPKSARRSPMRRQSVRKHEGEYDAALEVQDHWKSAAGWIAVVVAAMLLVDAFLMPGLVRRRRANADGCRLCG